ncbi:auxin-responsive protein IAA6-like isoform X2 [Miscanthus floridulus]|uniref:auxin-responsive protein IAA6-like isoform X2 n=1 Tax=Miscanthus floridulus TaxID=154761 RepID=UPI0034596C1D
MGDSKAREPLPRLLDLIPDGKQWKGREAQGAGRSRNTGFGSEEDKQLELKLGPPGLLKEGTTAAAASRDEGIRREIPALSLGCFPHKPSKPAVNTTATGTKRGFLDTIEAKTEGRDEQKQQAGAGCGNELALDEKIPAASERKKGFCPPTSQHAPPAATVHNRPHAQGRRPSAPVVGWPPVRSFRRNLAHGGSSKQSTEPHNSEASMKEKLACKKNPLVKINMDGIPIGRKVDLGAYDSYERLSLGVKELFHGFLEAQKDLSSAGSTQLGATEKIFSQLLDGSGEYTLVYEDNEGDRMLVGDVPWNVFVSTAKRLRVLRSSELSHGLIAVAPRRGPDC